MYALFLHGAKTHIQKEEEDTELNNDGCAVLIISFLYWVKIILQIYFSKEALEANLDLNFVIY